MPNIIPGRDVPDDGASRPVQPVGDRSAPDRVGRPSPDTTLFTFYGLDGGSFRLTYYQLQQIGWLAPGIDFSSGSTLEYYGKFLQGKYERAYRDGTLPSLFGGSGGGGGSAAATYVPPDEGSVREQVKAYVVATTGTASKTIVDAAVARYMEAAKQSFDQRDTQGIDPYFAMQEVVRASSAYKAVNRLRPESVDEMEWVAGRQAKLRQLGLSAVRAEQVGIEQSIAGSSDEALIDAAQTAQVQETGRLLSSQRDELKRSAMAAARLM